MNKQLCKIHNEPVLNYENDAQQKFLCRFCTYQTLQKQNKDDFDNQQKQVFKLIEFLYDKKILQIQEFAQKIEQFIQEVQQKLKKFKLKVDQNMSQIIEKQNQVKSNCIDFITVIFNQIVEEELNINTYVVQMHQIFDSELKCLETTTQLDQLYQLLNNQQIDVNDRVQQAQVKIETKLVIDKKFDYQILQQSSYKQNNYCYAIAFNKDASLMIAGCDKIIKAFEFKDEKLREVQQLKVHSKDISCLEFMRKSNQFISGSDDSKIIIWELNQNNLWQSKQILRAHSDQIICITKNKNEDILISGSYDNKIISWQKINDEWISNQTIDCLSSVWSISLSDQEDKLIASVYDKLILIFEQKGKKWIINQKIPVELLGYRLCFIHQDQFVFQPKDRLHLSIFDFDSKNQTFKKKQEVQFEYITFECYSLFPIRYIPQIELLLLKNGDYINFIRRCQDGQFRIEQTINFGTQGSYGCITDDGRYIATWDYKSKEIQIRKFDY